MTAATGRGDATFGGHPHAAPRAARLRITVSSRLLAAARVVSSAEALAGAALLTLSAVLVWALANVLLSPRIADANYGPAATSRYLPIAVAALIPVLLVLAVLAMRVRLRLPASPVLRRAAVPLVLTAAFVVQVFIAWNTARIPTSDPFVIISAAAHAAKPDSSPLIPTGIADGYFSRYSNNIAPTAVYASLFRVVGLVGAPGITRLVLAALALNAVALLVGSILTLVAVRRLLGVRATTFAVGPVALFLVLSPWLNIPYTDSLALPFPVALLLLALRIPTRLSWRAGAVAWLAYGVVAGIGYSIKPTVIFAAIALAIYAALSSVRAARAAGTPLVRPVSAMAVGVVAVVLAVLGFTLFEQLSGVVGFSPFTNRNTLPITHFMAMGAHGTGGYDDSDVQRSAATPPDVRFGTDLQLFFSRVAALGPLGYPLFLGQKLLWVLGDGSFYQGLDGYGPVVSFRTDAMAHWVQQWYLLQGDQHFLLSTVWQAAWLVLLLLIAVPRRGRRSGIQGALALSILLLLAYLLLSEARSRYLYIYLPFFIVLAAAGAGRLAVLLRARAARRRAPVQRRTAVA